jgi:hypothetical protein
VKREWSQASVIVGKRKKRSKKIKIKTKTTTVLGCIKKRKKTQKEKAR